MRWAVLAAVRGRAAALPADVVAQTLIRRAGILRDWLLFLERYPVLLLPVSAELPFKDGLDLDSPASFERVWRAQLVQTGLPVDGAARADGVDGAWWAGRRWGCS